LKTASHVKLKYADMIYDIVPCPAPRMTKSDKWKKRPCVLRYFDFKKQCKEKGITFENGQEITFVMPFKKTYSEKKKKSLLEQPHLQKPDIDNLLKALFDAIFEDDSHIYHISSIKKVWGYEGKIIIK
jgi:Holliday junction resolvase RusA-like endonuclease